MGWLDTAGSVLGTVGNIAGTAYDIYQGFQSNKLANKYADMAGASSALQQQYAKELYDRQKSLYWPLENIQVQYQTEDIQNMRPYYQNQLNYYGQRLNQQIENQKTLDPIFDQTEQDLIKKLVEGEDVLSERYRNQAAVDVGQAFGSQREQDIRNMGLAGINPNSGQYSNYLNRMGTQEALAKSGAMTQAARSAEDTAISRQSTALNYRSGQALPTYSYQGINDAVIPSSFNSAGATGAGLAGMYNQNAQDSFTGANYLLSKLTNGSYNK